MSKSLCKPDELSQRTSTDHGNPGQRNRTSIPIFHASLLCGGLFERNVMLGGEGPQAARDESDRAELGPGCVHHIGGVGALLAQKPVLTIPTLQIVLCAGDGDLHCFPGRARSLSEAPSTGSQERLRSWEGFCSAPDPSWPPPSSWGSRQRSPGWTSERERQERLQCRTEPRPPAEVHSQPRSCDSSWSADGARQSSRAVISAD